MKRIIFAILISALCITSCDLSLDIDKYLFVEDTSSLAEVDAKGGSVSINVNWSGCVWSVYENVKSGCDSLVTNIAPYWGGGFSSYGNTIVYMEVAPNESTQQRETEIILCTAEYSGDEADTISQSIKLVQKGADPTPAEASDE